MCRAWCLWCLCALWLQQLFFFCLLFFSSRVIPVSLRLSSCFLHCKRTQCLVLCYDAQLGCKVWSAARATLSCLSARLLCALRCCGSEGEREGFICSSLKACLFFFSSYFVSSRSTSGERRSHWGCIRGLLRLRERVRNEREYTGTQLVKLYTHGYLCSLRNL